MGALNTPNAKLGQDILKKVVEAVKKDKLSVAELVYQNNPQATVKSLHEHGLLNVSGTDAKAVSNALRLSLYKGELNTLRNALSIVPFNQNTPNVTVNPAIWQALGIQYGNIAALVKTYL